MLKSLELFGFKTFADRTKFDFTEGITCIVGPNGSGKSNVVDGIKWILGDQSPKSLRGKEMADVIFNGSTGRKASSLAEASMTFDNSSGFLPVDAAEVRIGRRLWRSGDSEYLINGGAARLRDVRDLFLGTGATTSAYNIIEQGRVDQILQASATSRRAVFEEAAGVSRYKSRKTEALRKLERVAHNILRLTDIVEEVETQLTATRAQAAKATKYRDLSEQVRTLWLGLSADEYRYLSSQLERHEHKVREAQHRIEELNHSQQNLEKELQELDSQSVAIDEELRGLERQNASTRESIASHNSTIHHQKLRLRELQHEIDRLSIQQRTLTARAQRAADERKRSGRELDVFRKQYESHQAALLDRESEVREQSALLEKERDALLEDRRGLQDNAQQITACQHELASLETQLESLQTARKNLVSRRAGIDQSLATAKKELEVQQQHVDSVAERLAAVQQKCQDERTQYEQSLDAHGQSKHHLAQLREQRSALIARQSVLEDLERRQEGLGLGVREILSRAAKSSLPPWNHIVGSVADLFQVDLEDAPFLEVALGHRAQLLVIDDPASLISYLNENPETFSGRVGFVAIPQTGGSQETTNFNGTTTDSSSCVWRMHVTHHPDRTADLSEAPGVLKRADELVTTTADVQGLATHLLSDTWIVDTLDRALELSCGRGRGCRFVTLQGELLEPDGTLFAGTERGESAVVSRKSELRRLKNDLTQLERTIAKEEQRIASLDDSLGELREICAATESERQKIQDELSRVRVEADRQQKDVDRIVQERAALDRDDSELETQIEERASAIADGRTRLAAAEEDQRSLRERTEEREREIARLEHQKQAVAQSLTEEKLEFAKQEERLSSFQEVFARLEKGTHESLEQCEEARRRFEATRKKVQKTTLHLLNTSAELAEICLDEEKLSRSVDQLALEKAALRTRRSRLAEQENQLRQQQRGSDEELRTGEISARDVRHQLETIQGRISEEYQVRISDVIESGASAVRDYLKETSKQEASPNEAVNGKPDDTSGETLTNSDGSDAEMLTSQDEPDTENTDAIPADDQMKSEDDASFEEVRSHLEQRLERLRRKQKTMGSVNTDSLGELDDLEGRYEQLNSQLQDLVEAKATLEEIVRKINAESRRMFLSSFETIRGHFQELYRKLFAGGEGDVILEDPNDVLECGIDIVARPPGKEPKSISLLSGGEKTLTAVALLLAIFKSCPSPFCVLDEVDAALDEANIERYTAVLDEFKSTTQFLIVTHSKVTMTVGDVIYGVTMQQSGVSKKIAVRFEDVGEDGQIRVGSSTSGESSARSESDAA